MKELRYRISFLLLLGILASTSVNAKENSPQPSLQSQYEQQVTDSLKNYLKTLKKSGYSSNTKNLLKRKSKQKAQAFCFNWNEVVPSAIEGKKNYEIISAGNSWNALTVREAKRIALKWCKKRPATRTGACECEILNVNGDFRLSPAAKEKIASFIIASRQTEPEQTMTAEVKNGDQKPRSGTEDSVSPKTQAKAFFADVVDFIKTKPDVDIVKFAELYNARPTQDIEWTDEVDARYAQIKDELLEYEMFRSFHEEKAKQRELAQIQERDALVEELKGTVEKLENIIAEKFGTKEANLALESLKQNRSLIEEITKVSNDQISEALLASNVILGESESQGDIANAQQSSQSMTDMGQAQKLAQNVQNKSNITTSLKDTASGLLGVVEDFSQGKTSGSLDLGSLSQSSDSRSSQPQQREEATKNEKRIAESANQKQQQKKHQKEKEQKKLAEISKRIERKPDKVAADFKTIYSKFAGSSQNDQILGLSNLRGHFEIVRDTIYLLRSTPEIQKDFQRSCNLMDRALEEQIMQIHETIKMLDKNIPGIWNSYEKCWNNFLASLLESILPEALIDLDLETIRSRVFTVIDWLQFLEQSPIRPYDFIVPEGAKAHDIRPALHRLASPEKMGFYSKTERVLYIRRPSITVLPILSALALKAAAENDLSESDIPSQDKSEMADMVRAIHAYTLPFRFEYLTKVKNLGMIEARIKALSITPIFYAAYFQLAASTELSKRVEGLDAAFKKAVDANSAVKNEFGLAELNSIEKLKYFYIVQRCYDKRKGHAMQYINYDQFKDAQENFKKLKKLIDSSEVSLEKVDKEARKILNAELLYLLYDTYNEKAHFPCEDSLTKLAQVAHGKEASGAIEQMESMIAN